MEKPSAHPRIVIVTGKLDRGGAEQHIVRIAPALKSAGIDIELFLLERGGVLEKELADQGVVIRGLNRSTGLMRHLVHSSYELFRYLRAARPDAVHFFLPQPYLVGSVVAMAARQRVRIMSRRSLNHYQWRHPLLARFERWLHRSTSVLLGNSKAVIEQLEQESAEHDRIALIHNGIVLPNLPSLDMRAHVRAELGVSGAAFVIVVVANLISYKGHRDLFDALVPIAGSLPDPWQLVLVGRDAGAEADLRSHADAIELSGHVIWAGERSDVPRILSAADVFVLPSHQEGFSNALIEAMASGLPVIATAVGGNVDAIVDGESGQLVALRAPEQLGAAILQLALDPERRKSYGAAARQRVERVFSFEICVSRYENLYRQLERIGRDPVQAIVDGSVNRPS
ncbi:glycosyltransferase [soil metagenome]